MTESNKEYKEYNWIQTLLCWLRNPSMIFGVHNEMPEAERGAAIQTLEDLQQEYIDTGEVADFVNTKLKKKIKKLKGDNG